MTEIPLHARVDAVDGECGKSRAVIVDRETRIPTHLVLEMRGQPDSAQRLVPVDQIEVATADYIRVRCTKADLAAMPRFTETEFVLAAAPDYTEEAFYAGGAYYVPPMAMGESSRYVEIQRELIPEGGVALHHGLNVKATDGSVGKVSHLLADPETGAINHFALQGGHLWGKKVVVIPVDAVESVDDTTVHLKLSRKDLELLPAMGKAHGGPSGKRVDMVGIVYPGDLEKASKELEFARDLHRRKTIKLLNAATIVKDADGKVTITETGEWSGRKGALVGAVAGGLLGVITGGVGFVAAALVGAAGGGLIAAKTDQGFSNRFLNNLAAQMKPNRSALLLLAEHEWVSATIDSLAAEDRIVVTQELSDLLVQRILNKGGSEEEPQ